MSDTNSILLIGIGGGGCAVARAVRASFGERMRCLLLDTDAASGTTDDNFLLLGANRLSGHGAGGDVVAARMATTDSRRDIEARLEGCRLAVVVTTLGGGTGGGTTVETAKILRELAIPSVIFATTPFTFEGEDRQRTARGVMTMIDESAGAAFFIPLDKLVGDAETLDGALSRAIETVAAGVTLFWRLVDKPGYLRLDAERIRHLVARAGRGRFATMTAEGPNRAERITDALARAPLLTEGSGPVRAILCGVLAGEDLRLSEIGRISEDVRLSFGQQATFELATVNDEETFGGRISVALLLFESGNADGSAADEGNLPGRRRRKRSGGTSGGVQNRGRFNNAEPTIWNGEDLDLPTYLRHDITFDL